MIVFAHTPCALAVPLRIDGRADEPAWAEAQVFEQFVVTEPFTRSAAAHPTQVRMLATPEGLAFAFRCTQPPGVPRQRERTPRDADAPGDRVNVFIDFNADGEVAYNFTVALSGAIQDATITNETAYSPDWDGEWAHAVAEDAEGWSAEIMLPWSIAAMRDSTAERRTVAVMFDRVLGVTAERSGFPAASFNRPRFVSEFHPVEIDQYQRALLDWFPYTTVQHDLIDGGIDAKAGLDVFWKPSGDFQLTATLNPDFGQVEADELVVNFDAVETFFSDRRPFFTENQSLFDLRTPDSGQLIYTRRIGGPRDDDPGRPADLDLALKLNGSAAGFDYGTLVALESDYADDLGSGFFAQRVVRSADVLGFGWLGTHTDRPFLDRTATVQAFDATWRPGPGLALTGQVLLSRIDDDDGRSDGHGAWFRLDLTPSPALRHELEVTHFDGALNFNDIGFQRRNSLNELEWTTQYQQTGFGPDALLRGIDWRAELQYRSNDRGDRLPVALIPEVTLQHTRGGRSLFSFYFESAGADDLISRGNGLVAQPPEWSVYVEHETPRIGDWQFEFSVNPYEVNLDDDGLAVAGELAWFASDTFGLEAKAIWRRSDAWLIWQRDTLFGRFDRNQAEFSLDANWFPAPSHELRLKLQWLAIEAREGRALRIGRGGALRDAPDPVSDFEINNFGIQLRYRWTFAAQSDLFVVYSRGGFEERDGGTRGIDDLFQDAFSLRDADQILLKLRHRF